MHPHERHIDILGWIYIAHAVFLLVIAAVVFVAFAGSAFFEGIAEGDFGSMALGTLIGGIVGFCFTLIAIPSFFAGAGLLNRKPWARVFALILGFFKSFDFPIGFAVGIYAYWVLLQTDADYVFRDRSGYRDHYSTN